MHISYWWLKTRLWYQCSQKTSMIHQTFVWWALYILFKFVKFLIRHLGLVIGNVRHVRWFSWTLWLLSDISSVSAMEIDFMSLIYTDHQLNRKTWGRLKNTYELLNLRALKFSPVNKIHIFQRMVKIFCVVFQRYPLKFHTKYLTHTLKDMIFIQHWNFNRS